MVNYFARDDSTVLALVDAGSLFVCCLLAQVHNTAALVMQLVTASIRRCCPTNSSGPLAVSAFLRLVLPAKLLQNVASLGGLAAP